MPIRHITQVEIALSLWQGENVVAATYFAKFEVHEEHFRKFEESARTCSFPQKNLIQLSHLCQNQKFHLLHINSPVFISTNFALTPSANGLYGLYESRSINRTPFAPDISSSSEKVFGKTPVEETRFCPNFSFN